MKKLTLLLAILIITACNNNENKRAETLFYNIQTLMEKKEYSRVMDSIRMLRAKYPEAIEQRKAALEIWKEASLKFAQEEIGKTDSALQATTKEWKEETAIRKKNILKAKKDSLQIRYDALCGTVKVIHQRQQE